MDPNANLQEQEQILQRRPTSAESQQAVLGGRLRELRQALTGWLQGGGFAPDWSKAPLASYYFGIKVKAETWLEISVPYETADRPLWWHTAGKTQTASGYGRKLTSSKVIRLQGERVWRRVYVVCYSNSGTAYVVIRGQEYIVRD